MQELQYGGMERLVAESQFREVILVQILVFDLQEKTFVRSVKLVPGERAKSTKRSKTIL